MSADPVTADLVSGDIRARHEELMRQWSAALFDSCIALADIRREKTFRALNFESFTAFARSIHLSPTTARLTANAGDVMRLLRKTGHDTRVTHPDVMRPILELATENQADDVRARVVEKQARVIREAIKDADRCQEPFTVEVVARVAPRFGILPRKEWQARKRAKERDLWSDEKMREHVQQSVEHALATLRLYSDDIRSAKYFTIERLRTMPGFDEALLLLVDARDT